MLYNVLNTKGFMEIDKVLEFLKKMIDDREEARFNFIKLSLESKEKVKNRSEFIDLLATSLSKAQGEMAVAKKESENPYFKSNYADLEQIVSTSRPALTKYGLSVTQQIITDDSGATMLHTILVHSSGQWIESTMRVLPPKNDIQTISSYITYLKRINYAALIGVVASDEDDDGEKAVALSREAFAKGTALNHKYNPREESNEVITKEQREELEYELAEYPDIAESIKEALKIQSIADMPKSKYSASVRRVREIKQARNGK